VAAKGGKLRAAQISATKEALDRNNPTNADQIRLQASLMEEKDCAILPQLLARLGLRQGQGYEAILATFKPEAPPSPADLMAAARPHCEATVSAAIPDGG